MNPTREEVQEIRERTMKYDTKNLYQEEIVGLCDAYLELEAENAALREQVKAKDSEIARMFENWPD